MIAYHILYNISHGSNNLFTAVYKPMDVDLNLLALKNAVDNAILQLKAEETGLGFVPRINQTFQHYPFVPQRFFKNNNIMITYGPLYLIVVPLAVFMVVFEELMREKTQNLRRGM